MRFASSCHRLPWPPATAVYRTLYQVFSLLAIGVSALSSLCRRHCSHSRAAIPKHPARQSATGSHPLACHGVCDIPTAQSTTLCASAAQGYSTLGGLRSAMHASAATTTGEMLRTQTARHQRKAARAASPPPSNTKLPAQARNAGQGQTEHSEGRAAIGDCACEAESFVCTLAQGIV